MTIYIDKLPEFCVDCICCNDDIETPWFFCKLKREIVEDRYTERPADCPLKELVRCKDCTYRYTDGDNVVANYCLLAHNRVQPDKWFCADGIPISWAHFRGKKNDNT